MQYYIIWVVKNIFIYLVVFNNYYDIHNTLMYTHIKKEIFLKKWINLIKHK